MRKSPAVLAVAALLFVGWVTWLGVQALRDRRPVVVSRAQLAVSQYDVEVELAANPDGTLPASVRVTRVRWSADDRKPAEGEMINVRNLGKAQGYQDPGMYLLPLVRFKDKAAEFELAGLPLDPGNPLQDLLPRIYPMTEAALKQWDEVRGP
jgi:hypothetical protein